MNVLVSLGNLYLFALLTEERRYLQRIPIEVNLDGLLQLEDEASAALVYPAEKVELNEKITF